MTENKTLQPLILCNRKTDFHCLPPMNNVYMHRFKHSKIWMSRRF